MSITLYHSVEATCSQKVRFVLSEKELDWEETWLNLRKGEQFNPDYLRINPKAVVPTLVHDGRVVRESTVIVEYLDDVFPDPPLRPVDNYDRSRMRLLVKVFDEEVHPAIGVLTYAIVMRHQMNELKSPEELEEHFARITDQGRRERQRSTHELGLKAPSVQMALDTLRQALDLMDEYLEQGPWLAGPAFSLADASAMPYPVRMEALNLSGLWRDRPRIKDWLKDAVERGNSYGLDNPWGSSSFKEVVDKHTGESKEDIEKLLASTD